MQFDDNDLEVLEMPSAASGATGPATREEVLARLAKVRFRMAPRGESGYRVEEVDSFLDLLEAGVQAGQPIADTVERTRFRMTGRREPGYVVEDVDGFLDALGQWASGGSLPETSSPGGVAPMNRLPLVLGLVGLAVLAVIAVALFLL